MKNLVLTILTALILSIIGAGVSAYHDVMILKEKTLTYEQNVKEIKDDLREVKNDIKTLIGRKHD